MFAAELEVRLFHTERENFASEHHFLLLSNGTSSRYTSCILSRLHECLVAYM